MTCGKLRSLSFSPGITLTRPIRFFSKWSGSPKPVKDLDSMWAALYDEEGVRWGVHNTVVLTQ